MNQAEKNYLNLLKNILENGDERSDRTGIGTKSIFGTQLRFDLSNDTLPLLTTKRMFTKGIIEELIFFINGKTQTKELEAKGVNIWKSNTSREFLDSRGLTDYPEGEMGPMYGYQWRNFGADEIYVGSNSDDQDHCIEIPGVDQLQNCFDLIKKDPTSRRILITAYNPAVSHKCVLDPCHMFLQFYVDGNNLSLQWYQRSVDSFLGLPFNITSYAVLTHMMAIATGLKAKELIFVGGDTHLYSNHLDQVKEQISREPYEFPKLNIKSKINSIEDMEKLSFEDFEIIGYKSHPAIKAPMAV